MLNHVTELPAAEVYKLQMYPPTADSDPPPIRYRNVGSRSNIFRWLGFRYRVTRIEAAICLLTSLTDN